MITPTDPTITTDKTGKIRRARANKTKKPYITKSGKIVKLTIAQKEYADLKRQRPKASSVSLALETHPNVTYGTARQIANKYDKNKDIAIYNSDIVQRAKDKISQLIDSENETIALKASDSVLDRQLGKPTNTVQLNATTEVDTASIEQSALLAAKFIEYLKNSQSTGVDAQATPVIHDII